MTAASSSLSLRPFPAWWTVTSPPDGNRKRPWPLIRTFIFPFGTLLLFCSYFFCSLVSASTLSLSSKLRCALPVCVRRVRDKGRHWGQHHRGVSCLQPAGNLCCMWTLGLYGKFWYNMSWLQMHSKLVHKCGTFTGSKRKNPCVRCVVQVVNHLFLFALSGRATHLLASVQGLPGIWHQRCCCYCHNIR